RPRDAREAGRTKRGVEGKRLAQDDGEAFVARSVSRRRSSARLLAEKRPRVADGAAVSETIGIDAAYIGSGRAAVGRRSRTARGLGVSLREPDSSGEPEPRSPMRRSRHSGLEDPIDAERHRPRTLHAGDARRAVGP